MQRGCFVIRVKKDRMEEYKARHAAVWPEMLQALSDSGWRNYSLFLRGDGLLIGVTLIADGFGFHIDKAYIYAAMGFSVFVEALNLRRRQKSAALELRPTFLKEQSEG